ncbi:hypothetical protein [Streptomyces lavendulae]|uniref:hypothetical protein n=1 Tax=Streptomyces lavendulae TaxID=1914 RepID=UPI00382FC200
MNAGINAGVRSCGKAGEWAIHRWMAWSGELASLTSLALAAPNTCSIASLYIHLWAINSTGKARSTALQAAG